MTDYRVVFDAELTFVNGGGLRADDFRLDVSSPEVTEADVGNLLVRHLGLLMVDQVRVTDMRLIEEQHKDRGIQLTRSRSIKAPASRLKPLRRGWSSSVTRSARA